MLRSVSKHVFTTRAMKLLLSFAVALLVGSSANAQSPPALELVVLGSGGPGATGRAGASHLVLVEGVPRILVDAGPGSFARLGEAKLPLGRLDVILLTHLHADHAGELPGIVKARAVSAGRPVLLRIFGPDAGRANGPDTADFPSTHRFVDLLFGKRGAFGYLPSFSAPIKFDVRSVPARAGQPRVLLDEDGLRITALAGHHRDAPAVLYRIEHSGQSISFTGDIDAQGHAALRRLAEGSSLLVFNSVVLDPPGSPEVLYTLHTAPQQIGELAAQLKVGKLVLAHIPPAVQAKRGEVESSIAASYAGPVVIAEDGLRVTP